MKTPEKILEISRKLRKNMTLSERIMWSFLKEGKLGVKFLRQKPIYVFTEDTGLERYIIPDFYCHEKKLILEIDGSIHDEYEIIHLDAVKEYELKKLGYRIFRIKNDQISENISKVISEIKLFL